MCNGSVGMQKQLAQPINKSTGRISNLHVDCVLGNVSLHPEIIIVLGVSLKWSCSTLHLAGRPPCASDDFANSTHSLRIGTDHGNGSRVLQDIFSSYRLSSDSGFCERDVFRYGTVKLHESGTSAP